MSQPNTSENWYQQPTKKHVILFAGMWLVGMVLLSAASTDFFTVPAKAKSHAAVLLLLVLPATWSMVRLVANYLSRRQA